MNDLELQEFVTLRERRPELYALVLKLVTTANAKGHDYSGTEDPNSNLRVSELFGVPAWKGVLIRMMDKVSRITNFAQHNFLEVKDESFTDTLLDLSVYSLLCIVMFNERPDKAND